MHFTWSIPILARHGFSPDKEKFKILSFKRNLFSDKELFEYQVPEKVSKVLPFKEVKKLTSLGLTIDDELSGEAYASKLIQSIWAKTEKLACYRNKKMSSVDSTTISQTWKSLVESTVMTHAHVAALWMEKEHIARIDSALKDSLSRLLKKGTDLGLDGGIVGNNPRADLFRYYQDSMTYGTAAIRQGMLVLDRLLRMGFKDVVEDLNSSRVICNIKNSDNKGNRKGSPCLIVTKKRATTTDNLKGNMEFNMRLPNTEKTAKVKYFTEKYSCKNMGECSLESEEETFLPMVSSCSTGGFDQKDSTTYAEFYGMHLARTDQK